jgi:hypothetical protein
MASERMSCSEIRFWAGILPEPPNDSSYHSERPSWDNSKSGKVTRTYFTEMLLIVFF